MHALKLIEYGKKYESNLDKILEDTSWKMSEPLEVLKKYAERRKFLKEGGELNLENAAKDLVRKWNKGEIKMFIEE